MLFQGIVTDALRYRNDTPDQIAVLPGCGVGVRPEWSIPEPICAISRDIRPPRRPDEAGRLSAATAPVKASRSEESVIAASPILGLFTLTRLGDYIDARVRQYIRLGIMGRKLQMVRRALIFIGCLAATVAITGYVLLAMKVFG
jgi:hypothetical protein